MLSFKKGKYTLEDLQIMDSALAYCISSLECHTDGCEDCKSHKVCDDFWNCKVYVKQLIQEKIQKNS